MNKKLIALIAMLCVVCMVFCSCGNESGTDKPNEGGNNNQQETSLEDVAGILEEPVLVISAGQSADVSIAKSLLTKAGVEFTVYEDGASLDGCKSVMLVPGVSVKGLGSAGISVEDELAATEALIAEIEKTDAKILVAHLGGSSRRDELTDQFLDAVFPAADCICALAEGNNKDGKFTNYASSANIPCAIAKDIVELVNVVKTMYGK